MNYSTCLINTATILRTSFYLVLSLSASLFAADFGSANWGMSSEQVKQLETRTNLTPFGQKNYLIYAVSLPGIQKTRLVYQFSNDRLVEGRFIFNANNTLDVSTFVAQYTTVKALISRQFGPPNSDQVIRPSKADLPITPADYINELASDRLILKSSWQSPTAAIYHQLAWNEDRPHHQLFYRPMTNSSQNMDSPSF